MKNNAVVLLWKGKNIPDYIVEKVAEILINSGVCIPEMLTIKVLDDDAVAKAVVREVSSVNVESSIKTDCNLAEAVKQSVIYIGKRFEASLKGTNGASGNIGMFAIELTNAVRTERYNTSFIGVGTNNELLTAIEILSTTNAVIPASLAKKYHFSQDVVEIIKKVHHSY